MLDRIAAFTGIPVSEEVLEAVAVKMLGKPEAKHVGGGNERQQQLLQRNTIRPCVRWGTGTTGGAAGWGSSRWRPCSAGRFSPSLDTPSLWALLKNEHNHLICIIACVVRFVGFLV